MSFMKVDTENILKKGDGQKNNKTIIIKSQNLALKGTTKTKLCQKSSM